ncbi:DUF429 domain-containing protein [Methylocapsa polymorpha]|uniref:DUF429 domain-containing protein n=1 Tax=Methylocapsa polymorpha TaxID=3080828 RepID=A0ABZ0HR10_9HYPH|nr:DUF429 domain-containing protein [Methylocapsa sp. RX1]
MVNNPEITAKGREPPTVGADGCKGGWIAVSFVAGDIGRAQTKIFADFKELIGAFAPDAIIGVDMPIGLPEQSGRGGRAADRAARTFLGPRGVTVFPVPSRAAVEAFDDGAPDKGYAQACKLEKENSEPSKSFSKQVFWIFPRIQQIDRLLRADAELQNRVFEVHPEVSFAVMNNGEALSDGKKSKEGRELRRELLAKQGFAMDFLEEKPPRGAAWDDFYDACACAWSARRISAEEHRVFPAMPGVDAEGLPVAIWA